MGGKHTLVLYAVLLALLGFIIVIRPSNLEDISH